MAEVHVTATVFKNLAVKRRKTGEHPIFLGPIFLHGNSDSQTFKVFFKHLANELENEPSAPTFGSDDERAMRLAIDKAFPSGTSITCTLHLRRNISDHLQDKVGATKQIRNEILDSIFGVDGILSSDDSVVFERRVQETRDIAENSAPGFTDYLTSVCCQS